MKFLRNKFKHCLILILWNSIRFYVISSLFILMGLPWIINFSMILSLYLIGIFEKYRYVIIVNNTVNVVTCFFIFVKFACTLKVWKWMKEEFPSLERLTCRSSFIVNKFRIVKDPIVSSGNTSRGANDINGFSNEIELIE